MFTGLVQAIGEVIDVRNSGGVSRFVVRTPWADLEDGESIAVDGVCLTAVSRKKTVASFDVVGETLKRTTLGRARKGTRVNLERSLRAGDRLGGHFVTGHVDAVAAIASTRRTGGDLLFRFRIPASLAPEIARKGSIAVDGVSLTVVSASRTDFTCTLIPFTLLHTTLGVRRDGDPVNIETDILAKYVRRVRGR